MLNYNQLQLIYEIRDQLDQIGDTLEALLKATKRIEKKA